MQDLRYLSHQGNRDKHVNHLGPTKYLTSLPFWGTKCQIPNIRLDFALSVNLVVYLLAEGLVGSGHGIVMPWPLLDDAHQLHPGVVLPPMARHPTLPHRHDCSALPGGHPGPYYGIKNGTEPKFRHRPT